jgi:hypothetical protein
VSLFEYLSVLVSIVIALGISEIASSWGRMLRHRAHVRFYWLHAFWSAFTALLMVQFWWGFWEFRTVEVWTFVGLLGVVVESLVLVIAAIVLVPHGDAREPLDLRAHYFEQHRLFFALGALLIAQLMVIDSVVGGQPYLHPENAFRLPGVLLACTLAVSGNERLHAGLAALGGLLFVGFAAFRFTQ